MAKYRTSADFEICEQISVAYFKSIPAQSKNDSLWNCIALLATIFNAGRVQGIREERKNKRSSDNE